MATSLAVWKLLAQRAHDGAPFRPGVHPHRELAGLRQAHGHHRLVGLAVAVGREAPGGTRRRLAGGADAGSEKDRGTRVAFPDGRRTSSPIRSRRPQLGRTPLEPDRPSGPSSRRHTRCLPPDTSGRGRSRHRRLAGPGRAPRAMAIDRRWPAPGRRSCPRSQVTHREGHPRGQEQLGLRRRAVDHGADLGRHGHVARLRIRGEEPSPDRHPPFRLAMHIDDHGLGERSVRAGLDDEAPDGNRSVGRSPPTSTREPARRSPRRPGTRDRASPHSRRTSA